MTNPGTIISSQLIRDAIKSSQKKKVRLFKVAGKRSIDSCSRRVAAGARDTHRGRERERERGGSQDLATCLIRSSAVKWKTH